ncbi:Vitelline membrane outer layer protein 1 [Pleodorina starrii]|nr:Vitelline membrane outer layer protein 1 [Pleodorina starrii]
MSEDKCGCDPELRVDLAAYGDRVTPGRANQITLARVNTPTRNILKKFDNNGDGRIDANEIQTIVTTLVAEKFKSRAFKIGLIILAVFTAVLLGAMFGLTWAVVAALKDTQVQGSVLVTNDREQTPVQVANIDMTVVGGRLVTRDSSSVVMTSTLQTPGHITTKTSFEKLLSLQNLVFVTADNARYSLAILGIARIPSNSSTDGYIVRVQTASGTLTLENGIWSVSNLTGPLLEGFFTVQDRGRRLAEQQLYFYFICEDGECGDAIPCGLPGLEACPVSEAVPEPGSDDATGSQSTDVATGITSVSCSRWSPLVLSCANAYDLCNLIPPTTTREQLFWSQPGCTSPCASPWVLSPRGVCEGSSSPRKFCCL